MPEPAAANPPTARTASRFARLFEPVDIASLVIFRMAFGLIMLWEVWRYFENGWIRRYYIDPEFHFTYLGFGWVRAWPGDGMYWHFLAMGVLAACIAFGFLYRVAATLFFLAFTYVFLLDQARYLNHFYLVCLISFLMIFIPAHRARSLDVRIRPSLRSETAPTWSLWLLRAQLGIVYVYAAVAKMNPDWLQGEPMRMWLEGRRDYDLLWGTLPVGRLFTEEWVVYAFSYGGLLLDLLVVPMLLWRPTRALAFVAATCFHVMNMWLFSIGIFPPFMIAATTLFLDPGWPRRLCLLFPPRSEGDAPAPAVARARPLTLALIGGYLAVQVLLPLRHFLYPGTVHWTEEGHRFSWHMKLRDKEGRVRFVATDPASGWSREIDPREFLTRRQVDKMKGRPDMLHRFALHVAEELREEGREQVEIRVNALVSLNGRRPQPLIDPTADLAAEKEGLHSKPWILPLTAPLSPPAAQAGDR